LEDLVIKVHREAKSRISTDVVSAVDISALGNSAITFAFPARGSRPSTFFAGAWGPNPAVQRNGVWIREAITPRIGDDPDLAPGHYRAFGKLVNGADEDVWELDDEGLEVQ
jgi:hypothetical protein